MGNNAKNARWLAKSAERLGAKDGKSAVQYLEAIIDGIAAGDIVAGKVLVATSEAGGSSSFAIPKDHTPLEVAQLCQSAIDLLNGERTIHRLFADFRCSNVS